MSEITRDKYLLDNERAVSAVMNDKISGGEGITPGIFRVAFVSASKTWKFWLAFMQYV